MNENKLEEPTPSWKGCIIFGIINILLVLLATNIRVILISLSLILILIIGMATSVHSMKADWKMGFKISSIGCVVGLLLHLCALILYVCNIASGILAIFLRIF